MRLIDADALKRRAQKVATESWKTRLTANVETVLNQFIDWIDQADTAEPERHGRWIEKRYSYVCSCCGEPCKDLVLGKPRWNFCPWCGERMMTKGETIEYAIAKECRRNSLAEWCESWDIAIEEFEEFLRLGREAFDANIAGEQE